MTLNAVVLPAPFGPINPTIWPSRTSNEIPSRATIPPNRRVTFRSESRAIDRGSLCRSDPKWQKNSASSAMAATLFRNLSELAAETHMSRGQKITNLIGVTVPFAGFLASVFFLWGSYVTWRDLTIFAVGYALTTLGISIGFHRLFTHRSYETFKSIRYGLAVLGSMAVQGPVIRWVSDHRKHHSFADREGDPHSPHAGFGPGFRGKIAGLWHAHVGWLFRNVGRAEWTKYAKDLLADRGMVFISRWFGVWVGLSLLLPFLAGWLWGGTVGAGLQALFWGGVIRIFLLHHITWSVNSVCHFVGSRRFRVKDESRNVWWLSWISFGESWHHNHHAFPSSAFHGLKPWELDIGGLVIRLMRRLGLVWKVNVPTPEMQQRRREALS